MAEWVLIDNGWASSEFVEQVKSQRRRRVPCEGTREGNFAARNVLHPAVPQGGEGRAEEEDAGTYNARQQRGGFGFGRERKRKRRWRGRKREG